MARDLRNNQTFDLLGDSGSVLGLVWGLLCTMSISDTERKHIVNRRFVEAAGGTALFHQVTANGINSNAKKGRT